MNAARFAAALVAGSMLALPLTAATTKQADAVLKQITPVRSLAPTGTGIPHEVATKVKPARPGSNGIDYHGGPVMTGTKTVYYIWYGKSGWGANSSAEVPILENLAQNIGGSPYFNINTTYTNGSGGKVDNSITFGGSVADNSSYLGTSLSDAQIQQIVADKITSGALPKSTNAVYFVLTSSNVNATSGFCTQYCGWHTHGTIGGSDIKYAFIGDPTRCPSSCAAQATGPNGASGADGMASIISHELEEAASDPDLNAWYDRRGNENADKCAWTFGTVTTTGGVQSNITLGSRRYLIQQNWVNASGGSCKMSF
jgi:hypothetical protein